MALERHQSVQSVRLNSGSIAADGLCWYMAREDLLTSFENVEHGFAASVFAPLLCVCV